MQYGLCIHSTAASSQKAIAETTTDCITSSLRSTSWLALRHASPSKHKRSVIYRTFSKRRQRSCDKFALKQIFQNVKAETASRRKLGWCKLIQQCWKPCWTFWDCVASKTANVLFCRVQVSWIRDTPYFIWQSRQFNNQKKLREINKFNFVYRLF